MPQQLSFSGAVDAVTSPHAIPEDTVQAATNVDFALERGAALVRRGCTMFWNGTAGTNTNTAKIRQIYRHYNNVSSIDSSPYYAQTDAGNVYRGLAGTWSLILTGGSGGDVGFGS